MTKALRRLDQAIEEQNDEQLRICIAELFNQTNDIDKAFYTRIERILCDTWHHEHEDIVGMIWLKNLNDNGFINPIMEIALQGEIYRPFDDELESTLRKCVHALKIIGTDDANLALEILLCSGNENVRYALENYK